MMGIQRSIVAALCLVTGGGCAAPYVAPVTITEVATDKAYGYSEHSPVKVGGAAEGQSASHRDAYFKLLLGPKGQPVSYVDQGTCCAFNLKTGGTEEGDLEVLLVSYRGMSKPVILYLDYYHFEAPKAPVGFTSAALSIIAPSSAQ